MDSLVEVVAEADGQGGTVLRRLLADGGLAVRRTGPGAVHLVGTAAGPLGGDRVELRFEVGPGATLRVDGVAATLALPGADGAPAGWSLAARVADGGTLVVVQQPLVVCARAWLRTSTVLDLAATGSVDLREQVLLGRHGEPGGRWRGRLQVTRAGRTVLRQTQSSEVLQAGPVPPGAGPVRALATRLMLGPAAEQVDEAAVGAAVGAPAGPVLTASGQASACRPAAGGLLLTATGADLGVAVRDLDALTARQPLRPGGRVPSAS